MNITMELIIQIIAVASAVGAIWWRLVVRIDEAKQALYDYRLEVTEKYASHEHLREVELRLVKQIDRLVEAIDGLRNDLRDSRGPR